MDETTIPDLVRATLALHAAQARMDHEKTVKELDGRTVLTGVAKVLRVRRDRQKAEAEAWERLLSVADGDRPVSGESWDFR